MDDEADFRCPKCDAPFHTDIVSEVIGNCLQCPACKRLFMLVRLNGKLGTVAVRQVPPNSELITEIGEGE